MNLGEKVGYGLAVGAAPSIAMILASAILSKLDVEAQIEACFQNFAAGLILAAVASELFPLMLEEDTSNADAMAGISVGFAIGLITIYGLDHLVEYIEEQDEENKKDEHIRSAKKTEFLGEVSGIQLMGLTELSGEGGVGGENDGGAGGSSTGVAASGSAPSATSRKNKKTYPKGYNQLEVVDGEPSILRDTADTLMRAAIGRKSYSMDSQDETSELRAAGDWESEPVQRASLAIASPAHRRHITEHLVELAESIKFMERQSNLLIHSTVLHTGGGSSNHAAGSLSSGFDSDGSTSQSSTGTSGVEGGEGSATRVLTVAQTEEIAEKIDEEVHSLQYKLDHCRRLLQGSEANLGGDVDGNNTLRAPFASSFWVTEERKKAMKKRLALLKHAVEHLMEHIQEPEINQFVLEEMHEHMDEMDEQIAFFHESVESAAAKWQRSPSMPSVSVGDKVPMGLVVPVVIDGFVDGFLIGVATALSLKAGAILGVANILEMSFLGMAYSSRLQKCTGSSYLMRTIALYTPPIVMFAASGLGAALAVASEEFPAFYIGFVAFGVVALLFLVCNELLIEARAAQGDDEKWWISILVFLGIYIVLMSNLLIPVG